MCEWMQVRAMWHSVICFLFVGELECSFQAKMTMIVVKHVHFVMDDQDHKLLSGC